MRSNTGKFTSLLFNVSRIGSGKLMSGLCSCRPEHRFQQLRYITSPSSISSTDDARTTNVNATENDQEPATAAPSDMRFYKDGKLVSSKCDDGGDEAAPQEDEMENMFIQGPMGMEWNGPTRGGKRPEPTRYGDWERKGRASDF